MSKRTRARSLRYLKWSKFHGRGHAGTSQPKISAIKPLTLEALEQRCLLAADVVINEINYDPPDKTQFSEFIELYNNTDEAIDVSGWAFTDGVDYTFGADAEIPARGYVVVAQDPATADSLFGVSSFGPWSGQLRNSGERIQLRDDAGQVVDEVDYKRGFPWPTVGDRPGHSIELINPDVANDVGGNWRRAGTENESADTIVVSRDSEWSYFPGRSEPTDWLAPAFDDSSWDVGATPIGYGDSHVETQLAMRGNYSTVYLRQTFSVDDVNAIPSLLLKAQYDDGFNLWINGVHLVQANVNSDTTPFNATATNALENFEFVEFGLPTPNTFLVEGENVVMVHMVNGSLSGSSDAWFSAELIAGAASGNYSAGAANTVVSPNAAPAARRVSHGEGEVVSGSDVVVSTRVTDVEGVATVSLQYQVVRPGDWFGRYLKADLDGSPVLDPRYDDPAEWTTVAMNDQGVDGDSEAGDDTYSGVIPASVQEHRNLVRYRIHVEDVLGASANVPYPDDLNHNFAYFVYDGVPDWQGSLTSSTVERTFELDTYNPIATYHLLTKQDYHHDSQHIPNAQTSSYSGSEYLWPGTMVYDGEVYDNIRYRARGGVWRYAMGKNMWKFDFNRGAGFQAKDDYGNEYREQWDRLNFSALIQQGNYEHRGEQGLFESVGFKLFNLAGVESSNTHYVHFRVIDSESEAGANQYSGDFQGLYLAIEQPDGHLLDEHDLPDGNVYKIEGYRGDLKNQGPTQPTDGSDVNEFIGNVEGGNPSEDWWRENFDLERYYSYRTIVEGIHHFDIAYGKNYYYYNNPETGKFQVIPWDLDLTWANNMFGSGEHSLVRKVARNAAFETEYDNRVRELRDLLYNEEQTGLLIDEFASIVYDPDELSWVDADRYMWDYNPILSSSYVNSSKAGQGRFYGITSQNNFAGMVEVMKNYVRSRSTRLDRLIRDHDPPETPEVTYTGADPYPLNDLTFSTTEYAEESGTTFAAMEWRIAEITDPLNPQFGESAPLYEINATYESGEMAEFEPTWRVPSDMVREGGLYRVRVRMKSSDGVWSHWSEPSQFVAAAATGSGVTESLRISEIHYNPVDPTAAEIDAGFDDADEFEFMEVVNRGDSPIDLSNTSFQRIEIEGDEEGVDFQFEPGTLLEPGEVLLVVENTDAFQMRYGDDLPVAGQWSGKLGNGGEFVSLVDDGAIIHGFAYDDEWHVTTDGEGYSLEVVNINAEDIEDWHVAEGWHPSGEIGGSPGAVGVVAPEPLAGDFNLDNVVDFVDFLLLSGNFGKQPASFEDGDADGDDEVGFTDFLLLSANFGRMRE